MVTHAEVKEKAASTLTPPSHRISALPIAERLAMHSIPEPNTGCVLWVGYAAAGYGYLSVKGRDLKAHRLSYVEAKGPIPAGLEIDHLCQTPLCINPDHLEAVTHRVNVMRGRSPSALAARRTHCPSGHLLSGENVVMHGVGRGKKARRCRICRAAQMDAFRRRRAVA